MKVFLSNTKHVSKVIKCLHCQYSFCEDDEEHWKVGEDENVKESSLSVEATSYAVLTSLAMNDLDDARPFVNFVLKAMKPNGAFVSSQVKFFNK